MEMSCGIGTFAHEGRSKCLRNYLLYQRASGGAHVLIQCTMIRSARRGPGCNANCEARTFLSATPPKVTLKVMERQK